MTTPEPGHESPGGLIGSELRDAWPFLDAHEKVEGFRLLAPAEEEDFFLSLDVFAQLQLLEALPAAERQIWMRQLPPDERLLIVLSVYQGLESTEIAEAVGQPAGTVRWRLHEIREKLRHLLEKRMRHGE